MKLNLEKSTISLGGLFAFTSAIVGVVVWVFTFFYSKSDAEDRFNIQEKIINELQQKEDDNERLIQKMAEDLSYVRGRIDEALGIKR